MGKESRGYAARRRNRGSGQQQHTNGGGDSIRTPDSNAATREGKKTSGSRMLGSRRQRAKSRDSVSSSAAAAAAGDGKTLSTAMKVGGSISTAVAVALASMGIARYSRLTDTSSKHIDLDDLISKQPHGVEQQGALQSKTMQQPLELLIKQDDGWDRTSAKLIATDAYLRDFVCNHPTGGAYCHRNLHPVPRRRTHRIIDSALQSGETVMVLPRELQIWDLDALRDAFVREQLLEARHGGTGNALDGGAFLAAYLVRRQMIARGEWKVGTEAAGAVGTASESESVKDSDPLTDYMDMLPTYSDLAEYHPTLWPQSYLLDQLGRYTPAFMTVTAFRDMIASEYSALVRASDVFGANVSREEYTAARINVMSRSFGTGPPGGEEEIMDPYGELGNELTYYKARAGVDLTLGCRAMSPILDTWDSHPNPNAEWRYDAKKRAFVIRAASNSGIPLGHDVIVSYGKYSDSFLFAKFGYVNGDGTSHTEAYINANHRLLDAGLMQQFSYLSWSGVYNVESNPGGRDPMQAQRKEILRYLTFDDGYDQCIMPDDSDHDEKWALKSLKFRHLQVIANLRDRWVMQIAPRNRNEGPGFSSSILITHKAPTFDIGNMKFDASKIVSTCRLLTLTNDDYEGQALSVLEEVLANNTAESFLVERQSDALEFRAASCVFRLVDMMLWRYPSTVKKDMDLLSSAPHDTLEGVPRPLLFGGKEWTAAHVRLGEMQSLEVLGGSMKAHARRLKEAITSKDGIGSVALTVRRKPCSMEHTLPLLDYSGG
mmetsp:Transcript_2829/g.6548  ORF Transcript_2829/g.6548 Transcript_2829/m.6548 type:complete len:772 (+) Transcript_2829:205-2520(+)